MNLAINIFQNLLPLYIIIGIAAFINKKIAIKTEIINHILIYFLIPIVVFSISIKENIIINNLILPLILILCTSTLAIIGYMAGKYFYQDNTKNILSYITSSSNMGYFGFPVIITIYGESGMAAATLLWLTYTIFEKLIGFFIAAKGNYSLKKSIFEIITLPSLYMMALGLYLHNQGVILSTPLAQTFEFAKNLMIILGMSIIGFAISKVKFKNIDFKFLSIGLVCKFILMPTLMLSLLSLEHIYFNIITDTFRNVAMTMSILPLGINTVIAASKYKNNEEKAAITVLISTIFALLYIPLIHAIF